LLLQQLQLILRQLFEGVVAMPFVKESLVWETLGHAEGDLRG